MTGRNSHARTDGTPVPGVGTTFPVGTAVCCRREMSSIEVTSPLAAPNATLTLHTCSSCGRHVWERDGQVVDRDSIVDAVKERVAEGKPRRAPRTPGLSVERGTPRPRAVRKPTPPTTGPPPPPADVQERLKGFTVHGT